MIHFLRKSRMAEHFDFIQYNNWQFLVSPREANPDDLVRDASRADVFLYQPTSPLYGILGTDEFCDSVVPKHCQNLSFSYQFNTGFFPIVRHGIWWTGAEVIEKAKRGENIVEQFEADTLHYDCLKRFTENLTEQMRREKECDLNLVPFIMQNYETKHLFLLCNHPASELLAEIARMVAERVNPEWGEPIHIRDTNEACLPGFHAQHPGVVRELRLQYTPIGGDRNYYKVLMRELMESKGEFK